MKYVRVNQRYFGYRFENCPDIKINTATTRSAWASL